MMQNGRETTSAPDLRELRAAQRARDRAVAFYLFDPRVSFIDVGPRIREREDKQLTNELTVRVHVRQKPRGPAFEAFAAHSPKRVIDEQQIGFPVDIVEADYRLQQYRYPPQPSSPRANIYNPLRGGISISNEWDYNYGTLGGIVKDRNTGAYMILSAWHVLASSAYSRPSLRIYQPGYSDGGSIKHTIAQLTRHAMNESIDAAVAELSNGRNLFNDQLDLGPVSGVTTPRFEMRITKSGRASAVTQGRITSLDTSGVTKIWYGGFERAVRHVFHIAQTPEGGEVSRGGDSGSWWLEVGTNRAVGLHIAGDNNPEYGLAIAMPQVLEALGIEIVTTVRPIEPARVVPARLVEPVRG